MEFLLRFTQISPRRMSDTPTLNSSVLEQWELFGGHWRVIEISEQSAEIELCACTGESLEHLQTEDLGMIGYLRSAIDADGAPG